MCALASRKDALATVGRRRRLRDLRGRRSSEGRQTIRDCSPRLLKLYTQMY